MNKLCIIRFIYRLKIHMLRWLSIGNLLNEVYDIYGFFYTKFY